MLAVVEVSAAMKALLTVSDDAQHLRMCSGMLVQMRQCRMSIGDGHVLAELAKLEQEMLRVAALVEAEDFWEAYSFPFGAH